MDLQKMEEFLIEHSKINKKFIIDFFGFQKKELYKEYDPYTISLDDVAYWLDTRKSKLKKTLNKSYIKDIDYIVLPPRGHQKEYGSTESIIILLKPYTFKKLCMLSKTKK